MALRDRFGGKEIIAGHVAHSGCTGLRRRQPARQPEESGERFSGICVNRPASCPVNSAMILNLI
ncbi:hypothetical protein VITFI_CDS0827 [Vitreoscilla filiformis]|uniref:Uncharacterized protein n=1 Tax=Vitreoscilla filiformis TaxID=63 RepID=A0A221KCA0_VITFI|nr:hypothetical protein VITFI_CDS0827 [Vitreoscilla filiformis]